jgi:phosphocarrier protein HPr
MVSQKVVITDPVGLHARPVGVLVDVATKFTAEVSFRCNGKEASLNSVLRVMALSVDEGDTVEVLAHGADEQDALDAIVVAMTERGLIG